MISTPITTAMMVLPSQFDEALRIPRSIWSNLFWQEGERERVLMQIPQKRVTKLINHHKVAAFPPQPRVGRPLGAAEGPKAFSREVETPVCVGKTRQNKNLELQQVLC
jgi:hypothetical protein